MRDAQVRRLPAVNDVGHLVGAISIDDLVLVAQVTEQAPTQGSLSGSMPLVASNGGSEASAACPGSAAGSIICLWRPGSPAGCGVRGTTPLHRMTAASRRIHSASAGINRWWSGKPVPVEGPPRAREPNRFGVLLPVLPMRPPRARGDQTNVRYIVIRADGPGRQSCHLRPSVQLRPKARGNRSATQEAQAQRKRRRGAGGPEDGTNPGEKRLRRMPRQ